MEFYEVIEKRRTCRDWQHKDVPLSTVKRIINAGLKAPTNNHLREWEFILLHTPEEKAKALRFTKTAVAEFEKNNPLASLPDKIQHNMYAYAMPRQYSMLFDAPYVIIPLFKADTLRANSVDELNAFASIWCVIENIFLAATAEGLGYSMSVPVGAEGAAVCKELNVPAGYLMPVFIGIGHFDSRAPKMEQHTCTAEEKIHFGTW